jgi:pre-mRNA-processing factor 17
MSLVPARNGANAPPSRSADLHREVGKTSTKGKVPTGYAEEIAISEQSFRSLHREVQSRDSVGKKRKRETKGDSGTVYGAGAYKGPWAKYEERMIDSDSGEEVEVSGDESGEEVVYEEDAIAAVPGRGTFAGTSYSETRGHPRTRLPGADVYACAARLGCGSCV